MISPEVRAEIRRLFYAEHFPMGTIAATLGVHHDTVKAAVGSDRFVSTPSLRRSQLDPFVPFIKDVLGKHPKLRSSRLFLMLRDRNYEGSVQQLRRVVRRLRPASETAYLALTTLPGEQGQVDWASFGTLQVGRAQRKLSCFVMVLSYSRRVFARFTFDQTLASFLEGHVLAFRDHQGVPRVLLYDNLKTAVLERMRDAVRFHPALLELAGHYHFRPEPCTVAAGWEKGRVERAIQYIRTSFAGARHYRDLDDANRQLQQWLDDVCNVRPWPQDRTRSVGDAWDDDKKALLPLPAHHADTRHLQLVRSGKTPYVRFDLNDYSIPHALVRKPLTLVANERTVLVLDATTEVARHTRSYDRSQRIEDHAHLAGLVAERQKAIVPKAQDRLRATVPEVDELLEALAVRGENLGTNVAQLASLLQLYGLDDFRAAVKEALARGTPRASSVGNIAERIRRSRSLPVVLPVELPDDPRIKDLRVLSHDPKTYDALTRTEGDDDDR